MKRTKLNLQCNFIVLEKEKLIENLGIHFESLFELPPLAARIYALLLLSTRNGLSFEQIITDLASSKSSVSTNLKLLQETKRITFVTKKGDRKRYFKPSAQFLCLRVKEGLEKLSKEQQMVNQIIAFNQTQQVDGFENVEPKLAVYQHHLNQLESQHKSALTALEKINDEL